MGLFILCATVSQLFFGIAKLGIILFKNKRLLRFHGKWGFCVLVLAYAQVMLQVNALEGAWFNEAQRDTIYVLGSLVALLTLMAEHILSALDGAAGPDGEVAPLSYDEVPAYS
eukprot:TRINITY_DN7073_c1_g1_i2.p2 TRINITY_DN7073_c1_g1~~TRINITY_DN7073_c1_g1_i2.p2  ORF type:complete len:113 (-),score=44.87 TRINITY_DN7073_c1_g1_i2:63-401(-)